MSKQINFTKRTTFSTKELQVTVPRGQVVTGIVARKRKDKKEKYYLYSHDMENLLLSATFDDKGNLLISTSSHPDTFQEQIIGTLSSDKNTKGYILVGTNGKTEMNFRIVDSPDKKLKMRRYEILAEGSEFDEVTQKLPELVDGNYELKFPYPNGVPSSKNMIFTFAQSNCLMFSKLHKDEFNISIKSPFSIYYAFALVITSFMKLKK